MFPDWLDGRAAVAMLILRMFVGLAFILHGYGKIHKIRMFSAKFSLPVPIGAAVVLAQVAGGSMLVIGLLTPIASLAIAITMVGAVSKCIRRGERFIDPENHTWESAGFYLVVLIVIVLLGPGTYSLDRWLF